MQQATFDLCDRVVIVTGAVGLLGREHCRALHDAGARVVVADLEQQECDAVADELGDALPVAVDITKPEAVARMLDTVLRRYDRVDGLINNAAINDKFDSDEEALERSRVETYPLELWRRSMDVNVTGTFLCCQAVGAEMAKRRAGSIVNIASTYGIVAPDQSLYVRPDGTRAFYKSPSYPTTKGAVLSLTTFLATYWGSVGVRVNAVSPGGVYAGQEPFFVESYSRRTPLGRMGRPDDLRGAVIYLVSDASRYVTGANIVVDGGFTVW